MSTVTTQNNAFALVALTAIGGKGVKAHEKAAHALTQGASAGVLIGAGKFRKPLIDAGIARDTSAMIAGVAHGQYAAAMATLVAISGKPFTYSSEGSSIPRADWKRLGAELASHTAKASVKALALHALWSAEADALRVEQAALRNASAVRIPAPVAPVAPVAPEFAEVF